MRANARKSPPKVTVPKKLARKLPVSHARANRMLGLAFGGFMLALGLFTRIVAAAIAIEMAVICFAVLYPAWSWGHHGMEYALLMGLVALGVFLQGGGRYSLDHLIGREF